ncbi:MAG: hypothetical protein RIS76_4259 [Verrucomicrobiota bacterium]|jgi:hypothetical protein
MPENKLGESRRSHCIGNFGPGAIVEFRTGEAAVSSVIGGLDYWDKFAPPAGLAHPQITYERRLQKLLKVEGFRLPPVDPDATASSKPFGYVPQFLIASRFPTWLQCPGCLNLGQIGRWQAGGPGDPRLRCPDCSDPDAGIEVYVVPARFIVACRHGHLQDFPWDAWVHHQPGCKGPGRLRLRQSAKAGLAGLILECLHCVASQPMEGAFGKETMKHLNVGCAGWQPWLSGAPSVTCLEIPRAMQRGASNTYFPVVASALAIPPFTEALQEMLNPYWADFLAQPPVEWPNVIKYGNLEAKLGLTKEQILEAALLSAKALEASDITSIRWEEYEKLSNPSATGDSTEFDIRHEPVPPALDAFFDRLVRVVRLREVRALRSFTRIKPPSGELEADSPTLAPISSGPPKKWLPAIEVRGEGIFLRFKLSALDQWEQDHPALGTRAATVHAAYQAAWGERHDTPPPRTVTARFLLVHSFAHALMRQLTISCGYSSASLRERLYVDAARKMAGLLIYTATPDSDGSLGGLERQGRSARMNELVPAAIRALEWCSNDPLCIHDVSTFSDPQNLAACHACMMAPETSCEEFNVLLDRATLIGLPGDKAAGFFAPLLDPLSAL